LLLRGYERAALTLNFVRALVDGGFADLHHPEYWDLGFVKHAQLKDAYQRIVNSIGDALDFFEGISGRGISEATLVDFYASHEGLHLLYEQAQTRFITRQNRWYNLSTHMPWIGMRTAQLDGAHVEFFRGISNPIGVKVGSAMDAAWLQGLVTTLNPQNQPGRLPFIHRFGGKAIEASLPRAIQAGKQTVQTVLWVCDPMHGNTETAAGGLKTRRFENILKELDLAFRIHADMGSHLGGVHVELTGDDVTECTGGARGLTDADLQRAYRSQVDPRLNHEQALELAMLIAERSQTRRSTARVAPLPSGGSAAREIRAHPRPRGGAPDRDQSRLLAQRARAADHSLHRGRRHRHRRDARHAACGRRRGREGLRRAPPHLLDGGVLGREGKP